MSNILSILIYTVIGVVCLFLGMMIFDTFYSKIEKRNLKESLKKQDEEFEEWFRENHPEYFK